MNDIADFNEGTKPNASVMVIRATKTRYMTFPYFENICTYKKHRREEKTFLSGVSHFNLSNSIFLMLEMTHSSAEHCDTALVCLLY